MNKLQYIALKPDEIITIDHYYKGCTEYIGKIRPVLSCSIGMCPNNYNYYEFFKKIPTKTPKGNSYG